jgi:hypothetical protein
MAVPASGIADVLVKAPWPNRQRHSMRHRSFSWALTLFLALLPTTGCLFRTRPVEKAYVEPALLESSQSALVDSINHQAEKIVSLQATVDIGISADGAKGGHVSDYTSVHGYVLARKPAMLRIIGLMPIDRTAVLDPVSNDQKFELWIPPRNRLFASHSGVQTHNVDRPLENIRPEDIYDALLIRPIDPEHEIAVMENDHEETLHDSRGSRVVREDYQLVVIRKGELGWVLSRKIVFSRNDLQPYRQYIYDQQGSLVTEARYANYRDYDGTSFPSQFEIFRPQDGYHITLTMLKLEINKTLQDDRFELEQPTDLVIP